VAADGKERSALSSQAAALSKRQQDAARLSLASNAFLVVVKVAAGLVSGSLSVLAEGVQSTMDVVASGLILVTVRVAALPPDRDHPYGHGKFENAASLAQVALILSTCGSLLWAAWNRWLNPQMPEVTWGVAALGTAIVVNGIVSARLFRVANETGSPALESEAVHLRGDLLSCAGVLVGLVLVRLTNEPRLDPAIAAVMAGFVAASALRLTRETVRPLLDESLPGTEEARVREVLDADSRVLGYHRLRTRRAGPQRMIDMHIQLDDELTFREAHSIAEEIEDAIRAVLPNVDIIVHPEPYEEESRHQRERHGASG